ncbi:MAG TPA: tetratricopeptide repeat protein [Opitutaceae bacterium]|nr:tetratricopeptide repeat protein [Opitutaceae bacterium]
MASPTSPTSPSPAGDDRPILVPDAPIPVPFDEKLRRFWARNSKLITILCVIIGLVIAGKGAWQIIQERREAGVAEEYAKLTTSDQLKSFAAANKGHRLAGVAYLRLADEAFTAGKYAEAGAQYSNAASALEGNILQPRAVVGGAVSKLLGGDRAGGEAALKSLSSDLSQPVAVRAEATYHLATLAAEAGDGATLQTLVAQLNTISPQSFWAQRAGFLKVETSAVTPLVTPTTVPAASTPAPKEAAPSVTFPSPKK